MFTIIIWIILGMIIIGAIPYILSFLVSIAIVCIMGYIGILAIAFIWEIVSQNLDTILNLLVQSLPFIIKAIIIITVIGFIISSAEKFIKEFYEKYIFTRVRKDILEILDNKLGMATAHQILEHIDTEDAIYRIFIKEHLSTITKELRNLEMSRKVERIDMNLSSGKSCAYKSKNIRPNINYLNYSCKEIVLD